MFVNIISGFQITTIKVHSRTGSESPQSHDAFDPFKKHLDSLNCVCSVQRRALVITSAEIRQKRVVFKKENYMIGGVAVADFMIIMVNI